MNSNLILDRKSYHCYLITKRGYCGYPSRSPPSGRRWVWPSSMPTPLPAVVPVAARRARRLLGIQQRRISWPPVSLLKSYFLPWVSRPIRGGCRMHQRVISSTVFKLSSNLKFFFLVMCFVWYSPYEIFGDLSFVIPLSVFYLVRMVFTIRMFSTFWIIINKY